MNYERDGGRVSLEYNDAPEVDVLPVGVWGHGGWAHLSVDDLRWLCTIAGPALLNELEKGA